MKILQTQLRNSLHYNNNSVRIRVGRVTECRLRSVTEVPVVRKLALSKKDLKGANLKRHVALCEICRSGERMDIEMDYIHCIPHPVICKRYDVSESSIERHARAYDMSSKRDRKSFYWKVIEKVNLEKMSVENALEAAKQLDRIERVIVDNPTPSNIQVVYSFGEKIANGAKPGLPDSKDRLQPASDAVSLPSLREEVPLI